MIPAKEAEEIHKILINKFEGSHGIGDIAAFKLVLTSPFQTFDNKSFIPFRYMEQRSSGIN